MKLSRLNKMIAGIIVIFLGIGMLLDNLNILDFNPFMLFPLLIIFFGMRLYSRNRRIIGGLLSFWGVILTLDVWFNVDVEESFGVIASIAIVYIGFRLVRSRKTDDPLNTPENPVPPFTNEQPSVHPTEQKTTTTATTTGETFTASTHTPTSTPTPTPTPTSTAHTAGSTPQMRIQTPPHQRSSVKDSRSSLIGDFHLTSGRFELNNLHIWHGVGDVVIDLSRALIQEEESFLIINGWIGSVTIYVPVDLPVSIAAEVTIGDMEIFGHRQGGLNRHVVMSAEQYDVAHRKVKIIVSLIVGDIDVKYI
ncbi:cell wall-active antibiotics response protein LiaF [Brevibacillus sp. SYSU BS000544]|uniref:cell wall-active antibiotics response protein LiaF n=1 Tax=Brevibacillus sp. SYSU BS000544 TaxID=3416443 RepID=UPI003CE5C44D